MTTKTRIKSLIAVAALLAVPAAAEIGIEGSASATSTVVDSGTAGTVTTPGPMVAGYDADALDGSGQPWLGLMTTGVNVGASPSAAGVQNVDVRVEWQALEVATGTWVTVASVELPTRQADGTNPARFGQVALPAPYAHGAFRAIYRFTWSSAGTGAVVATATVAPAAGDLACWTTVAPCTVGSDRLVA
jgi:hypothetical protein